MDPHCETRPLHDDPLLLESSARAQARRRALLRGKHILIIGGGAERNLFIYARIAELGACVHMADGAKSAWPSHVAPSGVLTSFIPFDFSSVPAKYAGNGDKTRPSDGNDQGEVDDTNDYHGLAARFVATLDETCESSAAVADFPPRFDAALTFDEAHLLPAATVAAALGCAFQPLGAVAAAQNKALTRRALRAAGIPTPAFRRVSSGAAAREAAEALGVPLIVKPTNGAHSAGVRQISSPEEAEEKYAAAAGVIRPAEDFVWAQGGGGVVVEQYLPGPEVDVDVLLSDGAVVYANVLDNWPSEAPWFEEHGFDAPSRLGEAVQQEAREHVARCIKALGFTDGLFHAEARCTPDGARLLEVNPRIGGGPVFVLHRAVWGVDLVEELCFIALGLRSRPCVASPGQQPGAEPQGPLTPRMHCVATCFPAPFCGTVERNGWLSWTREFDGRVISFVEFLREGEHVTGEEKGFPDNLGHLVVGARKREECVQVVEDIHERLEIPLKPDKEEGQNKKFNLSVP